MRGTKIESWIELDWKLINFGSVFNISILIEIIRNNLCLYTASEHESMYKIQNDSFCGCELSIWA